MFLKNNKYGSLSKRGKGKLDVELKDQLKNITNEILDSIDVNELTRTQKIQFLKSSLSYLLPKEIIPDNYVSEERPEKVEITILDNKGNDVTEREKVMKETLESLDNTDLGLAKDLNEIFNA